MTKVTPSQINLSPQTVENNTNSTTTSTTYVSQLADSVTLSVTVNVGANGLLLLLWSSYLLNSATGNFTFVSFALSGANTRSATDNDTAAQKFNNSDTWVTAHKLLTGLTPGSTTVTLQYRVGGGTGTFGNRKLTAIPL